MFSFMLLEALPVTLPVTVRFFQTGPPRPLGVVPVLLVPSFSLALPVAVLFPHLLHVQKSRNRKN